VAVVDGELPKAVEQIQEAVGLLEALGSTDDVAYLLMRRALAQERIGDREGAHSSLVRAHDLAEQRGSNSILAMTEFAMGQQKYEATGGAEGREFIVAAIKRAETAPNVAPQALASMYCSLAGLEGMEGIEDQLDIAHGHLARAWELALESHDMPVVALVGVKIAELTLASGEPGLAARLLGASDSVRGAPDRSDPDAAALIASTDGSAWRDG
jgi:hypothetical protein